MPLPMVGSLDLWKPHIYHMRLDILYMSSQVNVSSNIKE